MFILLIKKTTSQLNGIYKRVKFGNYKFCSKYRLTDDFIKQNADQLNWMAISQFQFLSSTILCDYKDKVKWRYASEFQILDEETIEKLSDFVDWFIISKHQQLSKQFIVKRFDKLSLEQLSKNYMIDDNLRKEMIVLYQLSC